MAEQTSSTVNAKIKKQADDVESILTSQYDLKRQSLIIRLLELLGFGAWIAAIIKLFQKQFEVAGILIVLGFLLTFIAYKTKLKGMRGKLKKLANEWGVSRKFMPMTRNIASIVKSDIDTVNYAVSTVEYENEGFWEIAVAKSTPPHSDFANALYTNKTESLHDAIYEHIKVEYMVKHISPSKWQDIMMKTITESIMS